MTLEEKRAFWRARNAAYRARHPERVRQHTRDWRARELAADPEAFYAKKRKTRAAWMAIPANRIRHCLSAAKRRARAAGLEFTITLEELLPLPELCPILGVRLNYAGTGKRGFVNDSASLDRIDSSRGYVPGNVRVICWRANRIKADATLAELRALLAYLERQCN